MQEHDVALHTALMSDDDEAGLADEDKENLEELGLEEVEETDGPESLPLDENIEE